MRKKRVGILILLFLASFAWYLEGPGSTPPGWWRTAEFWPRASSPIRWRAVAPWLKVTGQLSEISWSELWTYSRNFSDQPDQAGFVTLALVEEKEGAVCPALWQTPVGQVWGRESDGELLEFLLIEQLIERIYDNKTIGVEPGDVVIDVGGHLGTFTRLALFKGAKQVVVIEPEPTNLACLKKTFRAELQNRSVLLVEAAAWDSRDTLTFSVPPESNTGSGVPGEGGIYFESTIEVPAITIDEAVMELGLDRVDFLKMDIEGAESEAITGAKGILARHGPRLALCTYHGKGDRETLSGIVMDARPEYHFKPHRHHAYFY